ncbi:histidine kinase [Fusibacter paucivorans]|uniref:histidine kinase n=1 Tax=Fusibacter paucivorans TaxID=76009 RepID=A0ABS5PKR2_9FIRM|nr:LytS/YhcK type 5TM receptor domain-containing protein [Fusibacter paucivorans]MBS7525759.1 histidine kinase [Fusibacter paucivorans]
MLNLLMALIYRVGLIIMIGLVFSRAKSFVNILEKKALTLRDKLTISILFALLSVLGTYTGIKYNGSIVNTRVVGVAVGGLLGGPFVGMLAGLISGGHRYLIDIGGFTALSCGISTLTEGFIAGLLSKAFQNSHKKIAFALVTGIVLEALQMLIVILVARPIDAAVELVRVISFPMILVNSIGIALFLMIITNIQSINTLQARYRSRQALLIADKTTEALRAGLNESTAQVTAEYILSSTDFDAVSITDRYKALAHVGKESDHHYAGREIMTQITKNVLRTGEIMTAYSKEEIGCPQKNCHLQSAVIAPLKDGEIILGTLKFYRVTQGLSDVDVEIARGLSNLLSTQLRVTTLEAQSKLALSAEIKALQAQISPHFFFNTLNVISSLIRTNPMRAREVLMDLSSYLRNNMQSLKGEIYLRDEIMHTEKFLKIIQARFGDGIVFESDIQVNTEIKILPLIIQPIVENAVLHGIIPKGSVGKVTLSVYRQQEDLIINIADNGIGMPEEKLHEIQREGVQDSIGINNVKQRIKKHFGDRGHFQIDSHLGDGTVVTLTFPYQQEMEVKHA